MPWVLRVFRPDENWRYPFWKTIFTGKILAQSEVALTKMEESECDGVCTESEASCCDELILAERRGAWGLLCSYTSRDVVRSCLDYACVTCAHAGNSARGYGTVRRNVAPRTVPGAVTLSSLFMASVLDGLMPPFLLAAPLCLCMLVA